MHREQFRPKKSEMKKEKQKQTQIHMKRINLAGERKKKRHIKLKFIFEL